jgi:hypothetical protein
MPLPQFRSEIDFAAIRSENQTPARAGYDLASQVGLDFGLHTVERGHFFGIGRAAQELGLTGQENAADQGDHEAGKRHGGEQFDQGYAPFT